MVQFLSPKEAAELVKDGVTIGTNGFVTHAVPDVVLKAIEDRFLETGHPRDMTLTWAAGQGMGGAKNFGANRLGHEGMIKCAIGGHWNLMPAVGKLASEEKIDAYNFPQGTLAQLFRDIAANKIGTLTHVGLLTFVDPRLQGGKINKRTTKDLVELVTLNGQERLFYHAYPIDVCVLRGTYADENGNVSMEREGVTLEAVALAQAVKNNGGVVIVQVEGVVKAGTLDPKLIKIPGIYVTAIVEVSCEENMPEAPRDVINRHCGATKILTGSMPEVPLDERKIIARRAAMELEKGTVVNLGIGIPEVVSTVANEEGIGDYMTLTVEAGTVGGIPAGGLHFGVATNPECILDQCTQFDFYDGGGIDLAFLGLAEADEAGNINVSKLGSRITGCGGFINITQNAKKVFYCGTFTAKGLKLEAKDGKLTILNEGEQKKFVKNVGHVTFSAEYANQVGQPVMYITERAVFELREDGVHLTEVAPGIDIDKDILAHMDFVPKMETAPKLMDAKIFMSERMGLGK